MTPEDKVLLSSSRIDRDKILYMKVKWDEYGVAVELDMHAVDRSSLVVTMKILAENRGVGWRWIAKGFDNCMTMRKFLWTRSRNQGETSRGRILGIGNKKFILCGG